MNQPLPSSHDKRMSSDFWYAFAISMLKNADTEAIAASLVHACISTGIDIDEIEHEIERHFAADTPLP